MPLDQLLLLRLVMKLKPSKICVLPLPVFVGRLRGKYLKGWFDLTALSLGTKNSQLSTLAGLRKYSGLGK